MTGLFTILYSIFVLTMLLNISKCKKIDIKNILTFS